MSLHSDRRTIELNADEYRVESNRMAAEDTSKQEFDNGTGSKIKSGDFVTFYDIMSKKVPANYKSNNAAVEQQIEENFAKLSIGDRSQIDQEIDGTRCMLIDETPELLEYSLARLNIELESISYKKKVGFNESQKLPRTYINDPTFRLRFLRSQLLDVQKAALLLLKHCDFVLELFGRFALERQIELRDFSKHEMKWLLKGYVQLMPFRDKSGRRVIVQIMDSNVMIEQITRVRKEFLFRFDTIPFDSHFIFFF